MDVEDSKQNGGLFVMPSDSEVPTLIRAKRATIENDSNHYE